MDLKAQIAQTEVELQDVKSRKPEVYSRIVGYYRQVSNWCGGKKKEHEVRKQFDVSKFESEAE